MPKRTPIDSDVQTWRSRHMPVETVVRLRALAYIFGTTEEDIANQALAIGLDYLEGQEEHSGTANGTDGAEGYLEAGDDL